MTYGTMIGVNESLNDFVERNEQPSVKNCLLPISSIISNAAVCGVVGATLSVALPITIPTYFVVRQGIDDYNELVANEMKKLNLKK